MSHEEQTDLRIRRTHHYLQEAMIELITEKEFDVITLRFAFSGYLSARGYQAPVPGKE